ncbi:hypothetical protein ACFFJI_04505 [Allobacillus sp. GCM10007491]|uniref:Uncharacterized protein n=1 Tax=Allobacillus saliphilus TaxID=2912308 RepID=A0A941CW59_9BACI|nr:hypothetical protein [Allobacillus saliphilus]MBR7554779.1 hypothetical protein [Allobacillus saliphilus]
MELEKQQYVKFRREMDPINLEQKHIEDVCYVYLYEDKIVTDEQEYEIHQVFDLSYRMLSEEYGFFYLHTAKGVMTLNVKDEPIEFIKKFREVEQK